MAYVSQPRALKPSRSIERLVARRVVCARRTAAAATAIPERDPGDDDESIYTRPITRGSRYTTHTVHSSMPPATGHRGAMHAVSSSPTLAADRAVASIYLVLRPAGVQEALPPG